jgi:hypothetical protein
VLAVYTRPRDPDIPLDCLHETSKRLIAETRAPVPMKPGQPARSYYEYECNGMMFAPLGDVGEPNLISPLGGEFLVETVGCDRQIVMAVGGAHLCGRDAGLAGLTSTMGLRTCDQNR